MSERQEGPILQELFKHIKLDSKSGIWSCLTQLKNDSKCYKQFAKDGGLGILVNLLHCHNIKILNMTLSILANACMNSDAREKVYVYLFLYTFISINRYVFIKQSIFIKFNI